MAARWYNPATGQFTSQRHRHGQPGPNSAAANPFAYAGDDPLTATDPQRHMLCANVCGSLAFISSYRAHKASTTTKPSEPRTSTPARRGAAST